MIKKIFRHIIVFLFLIATIGYVINSHYCGNQIVSVSLFKKAANCKCHCPGCHEKTQSYKITDSFLLNKTILEKANNTILVLFAPKLFTISFPLASNKIFAVHSPPGISNKSLSLLEVFRL